MGPIGAQINALGPHAEASFGLLAISLYNAEGHHMALTAGIPLVDWFLNQSLCLFALDF